MADGNDPMPDMRSFSQNEVQFIFVYGTLKRGQMRNNMLSDCTYFMDDSLKGYLLHTGAYPALLLEPSGGDVHGEVYRLPTDKAKFHKTMEDLDYMEGFPDHYWRLPVLTWKNNVVWTYFYSRDRIDKNAAMVIPDGKWVGSNSAAIPLIRFLNDNPTMNFPTKPQCKYDNTARCQVVQQYLGHHTKHHTLSTYPAIWPTELKHYKPSPGANNFPGALSKALIPPVKEAPPMFQLAWLDVDGQIEKCEEHHVDGI